MSITINLGVDHLEKLIGGEGEVAVEVRQAAAAEFAKRYLKSLVNSPAMVAAVTETRDAVAAAIRDQLGRLEQRTVPGSWNKETVLNPAPVFKDKFDYMVRTGLNSILTELHDSIVKEVRESTERTLKWWVKELDTRLRKQLSDELVLQTRKAVEEKVRDAFKGEK